MPSSLKAGSNQRLQFSINETDLLAGTSDEFVMPEDGYIIGIDTIVQKAVTTGGTITVLTGDAGAVTVAGLTATIANAAAKGSRVSATPTKKSATRKVAKGARIQIKPTGFATAGAVKGILHISIGADTDGVIPY